MTPDGTVRLKKGELAGTLTTWNETAVSEELFLGKYTVRETRQVPGSTPRSSATFRYTSGAGFPAATSQEVRTESK